MKNGLTCIRTLLGGTILLLGIVSERAYAQSPPVDIIAPNGLATTEGNSYSPSPFGSLGSVRYQQVYDASQFSSITNGGGWITAISFRGNGIGPAGTLDFSAVISNIQVNLSTTPKAPDGLSLTFANNVGPDDTVVFDAGRLVLNTSGAGQPSRFGANIVLNAPFYYNPLLGNLLFDVRSYSGSGVAGYNGALDGQSELGDSISFVFTGDVNATSAVVESTFGLVTDFTVMPVPEPSTYFLMILGAVPLGWTVWRGKRRRGGNP